MNSKPNHMLSWLRRTKLRATDLEIHVPISPTPHFFTMVHYLAASWRLNGGPFADSRIIVTVGADDEPTDLHQALAWSRQYPIEWRWLDRELFRKQIYYATALERFRLSFRSRLVLMLDADTFCCGTFLPLAQKASSTGALAGLIAHCSPFLELPVKNSQVWWNRLAAGAQLPAPRLSCRHTGYGAMYHEHTASRCPPYFNLGMLLAPADAMSKIGEIIYAEMDHVNEVLTTGFRCQLALALALERLGIPTIEAPMRYNFANDEALAKHYRRELHDVRLFHYLRVGDFDKNRDVANHEAVQAFLARPDLHGVNRIMADRLRPVHAQVMLDLGRWVRLSASRCPKSVGTLS